jgi:hypothetical protein
MKDWTFLAKTCKIYFWIWCNVYLTFCDALSKIRAPTCSLHDAKSSIISRKLPWFFLFWSFIMYFKYPCLKCEPTKQYLMRF